MNNDVWEYFFLTTENNLKRFEHDRAILREQNFTKEVQDVILKLKETNVDVQYDLDFLVWMTKDSLKWEMTKEISEKAQDYSLENRSFNYLHSLLRNLFSFYNFLPHDRKYCFIKHGYPINLNIKLAKFSEYILYKQNEEIYQTVKISDADEIQEILNAISLLKLPLKMEEFKVTRDSVLLLQYDNE